ncbi:Zinc-binding alcohol dehydrogenase domain-containing protein cipB [Penicillium rolfsii]|nr:Zinc-binding alcohol dehydrogenase domain-containing protein cipB [Penicillium rolfsii]
MLDSGRYLSTYPFILGRDTAGIVEDIGDGVTRFRKGQRVIAPRSGNSAHAAYQVYSLASDRLSAPIPSHITFEQGAVLPLAISTAAAGLYLPEYLGLPLPSTVPKPSGDTLLIWGGSSSVGATAIQLAVASGLHVIATASSSNHAFVKSLGAHTIFDYISPTVVEDVLATLKTSQLAGVYDAIGNKMSTTSLVAITEKIPRPVPAVAVHPCEHPTAKFNPKPSEYNIYRLSSYGIAYPPNEAIGVAVWETFVPAALESGQLQVKPDPVVIGHGLESIQQGLEVQKAGVSAKKIVVTL